MSKISDYIKKELEKGFSLNTIKKSLLKAGHDLRAVEEEIASFGFKEEKFLVKSFKTYWLIFLVALVLITAIVLFLDSKPFFGVAKNLSFEDLSEKEQKSILQDSIKLCNKISDPGERNICLLKLAGDHGNTDICPLMQEDDIFYYACLDRIWLSDDCSYEKLAGENLTECRFNLLVDNNEIDMCYILRDMADSCVQAIYEKNKGNLEVCAQHPSCFEPWLRQNIGELPEDYCYALDEFDLKIICLTAFSNFTKDISFCETIDDLEYGKFDCYIAGISSPEDIKEICSSSVLQERALDEADPLFLTAGEQRKILCYDMVSAMISDGCESYKVLLEKENFLNSDDFIFVHNNLLDKLDEGINNGMEHDDNIKNILECRFA